MNKTTWIDINKDMERMHKNALLEALKENDFDRLHDILEAIANKTNVVYDWICFKETEEEGV